MAPGPTMRSRPSIVTMYPPWVRAESTLRWNAAMSSGASPCDEMAASSLRIAGLVTTRASSGWASGTWMISMRNSSLFGSRSGLSAEHPPSSVGDRTGAVPET